MLGPETPKLSWYTLSMVVFLWGMGLANPLGTAITMAPFGKEAGLASALLGFDDGNGGDGNLARLGANVSRRHNARWYTGNGPPDSAGIISRCPTCEVNTNSQA